MSGLAASRLRAWSRGLGEPGWLTARRLSALERARAAGEPADAASYGLEDRPLEAPTPAPELAAQGVIVSTLRRALRESPELVEARLAAPAGEGEDAAALRLNEALWADGWFVRVPAGVAAALPVQLGSDAARAAVERTLIVVEDSASLSLVEGCAGASASAARRLSVLEAWVGQRGALTAASVQAWPPDVSYRAFKRVSAGAGARVEWRDANLGARETDKRLRLRLAGGAAAEVEIAGFAASGQRQRLEVLAEGEGTAVLSSRAATLGGRLRAYLLAGPGARVERREALLDLEALPEEELFYLATRGFEERHAKAAALHAFFEPFAGRLPLEFAVEFTRQLDAELPILD